MKIITKNIEIMKVLSGENGDLYSFKFSDDEHNEFYKFYKEYEKYKQDPLFSAFSKVHSAIENMIELTGFQSTFFKKYQNNISKFRKTDNIRLYGFEINEDEFIVGNGNTKLGGKRAYQSSPALFRLVKILESLRPQVFQRLKANNVKTLEELFALNPENAKFEISYEDETE